MHPLHNSQITSLRNYFYNKATQSPLHLAITKADKKYTPLELCNTNLSLKDEPTIHNEKINLWSGKEIHGRYYNHSKNTSVDQRHSHTWLHNGNLFPETEGFMLAIQDGIINTRAYSKFIIKDPTVTDDKCRRCHNARETIEHITNSCSTLAPTKYLDRHNAAAKIIHQSIAIEHSLLNKHTPYYIYTPSDILENADYKLYWDKTLQSDKPLSCNRPDITFTDKKEKHTYLIDISIPNDQNVPAKYSEKIQKYIPLAIELERIWKQKTVTVIPIIISSTGLTHTSFIGHLSELNLPATIHNQTQKAVILQTCNIVRSFLRHQ